MRKKSIGGQMIAAFISLILLFVAFTILINFCFLGRYYQRMKEKTLIGTYREVLSMYDSEEYSELSKFCSKNNFSTVIYNMLDSTQPSYSNLRLEDEVRLKTRLFGYVAGLEEEGNQIMKKTGTYTILLNKDEIVQMDFMEMYGKTDSGVAFLIRCPMESIRESVLLSNRFYLMIGLAMSVVGALLMGFISRRIARPVTELTQLSQKMANLDFEARYTPRGVSEIDILGENFNRMSETLERTISELKTANNELQKDIEKKEQIDEMRKEFLSNVSHELKTPIALIQGYAEGLQDNINDDPESREFYCDVIIDEAAKMNQMVKKLLTLNHLEFGNQQVQMERFDLTELIRGVLQSSQLLADQAGVEMIFRQREPLYVWGDEFEVEEVMTNYLTNAIHYAKNEKKVDVRCVVNEKTVKTIVFNTGDAIPEEELEKIWIKFYKVDKARTREYGGSGIGLSIVKAIIESMNQQCGVNNFSNGVAFWFTLSI